MGEVIVRVSEDTILKDGDKELDLNTLVDGQELKIGYGAAMTLRPSASDNRYFY